MIVVCFRFETISLLTGQDLHVWCVSLMLRSDRQLLDSYMFHYCQKLQVRYWHVMTCNMSNVRSYIHNSANDIYKCLSHNFIKALMFFSQPCKLFLSWYHFHKQYLSLNVRTEVYTIFSAGQSVYQYWASSFWRHFKLFLWRKRQNGNKKKL